MLQLLKVKMAVKFINIILFISIILAAGVFIWYLIGDSPTIEYIVITFIFPVYIFVFGMFKGLNDKIENNYKSLINILNEKFDKVNEKFYVLGERIAKIEGGLSK